VWGVGENLAPKKRIQAPVFIHGIKENMYFEIRSMKNTASLLETPDLNYGVPYTPHPTPETPFMFLQAHLEFSGDSSLSITP
jgi:hypothetical protein